MRILKTAINPWTLRFADADLEKSFDTNRITYRDLPTFVKIGVWTMLLGFAARRLQLLFDAYYGSRMYSSDGELRLTLGFVFAVTVELLAHHISCLRFLQGAAIVVGTFWHIADSSCFYYPHEPTLIIMYILASYNTFRALPMICSVFTVLLFYSISWIVSACSLIICGCVFAFFYNLSYDLSISI